MYKRFVRKPGEDMNKPYIWMDDLDTWFTDEDYQNLDDLLKEGMFPLYTYPVKELTDEEIWEVIDNCFGVHAFNLDYQIALDEAREDAFELVKAILRKAQEK